MTKKGMERAGGNARPAREWDEAQSGQLEKAKGIQLVCHAYLMIKVIEMTEVKLVLGCTDGMGRAWQSTGHGHIRNPGGGPIPSQRQPRNTNNETRHKSIVRGIQAQTHLG
jgi:hypothetical protein